MKPDFEDSSGVLHDHDALNLVNFAHMIVYFQTNLTQIYPPYPHIMKLWRKQVLMLL